jgi:ATP-dependent RNA helicase RhlE
MQKLDSFRQIGLSEAIILSIGAHGFTNPTDIQAKAIPKILLREDLIIQAQTGSGKTACFAWPLLQMLVPSLDPNTVSAVILTPTRELAQQVSEALTQFSQYLAARPKILSVIGGENIDKQIEALNHGIDIVVATPGRLLDLIDKKAMALNQLKYFIIDEADKILDLGFAKEFASILKLLPSKRQNLFFSATYSSKVMSIIAKFANRPEHIFLEDQAPTVDHIEQRVIEVNKENRGPLLRHLIKQEGWRNGIIFVSSKILAHHLSAKLRKAGISATALHSNLTQAERTKALSVFKRQKVDFLVATDVAARGIDISKLPLVINFDLPRAPADYIHRIGRTGRAGESGMAVSFIDHLDQDHFKLIEKRANILLEREQIAGFELSGEAPVKINGGAPIKGKRKSKKDILREQAAKLKSETKIKV